MRWLREGFNRFRRSVWPFVALTVYGVVMLFVGLMEMAESEIGFFDSSALTGTLCVAIFGGRLLYMKVSK